MGADWKMLLKGCRDLKVTGDEVDVQFAEGRHQVVTVVDEAETYALCSMVTRSREIASRANEGLRLWRQHRTLSLVGFRVDRHGRLVGEGWVPKAGVTAEEMQLHVRLLARECDRLEHALTGRDVE